MAGRRARRGPSPRGGARRDGRVLAVWAGSPAHRDERLPWPPETGPFADDDSEIEAALATLHASAVLRGSDEDRQAMFDGLVRDLSLIPSLLR